MSDSSQGAVSNIKSVVGQMNPSWRGPASMSAGCMHSSPKQLWMSGIHDWLLLGELPSEAISVISKVLSMPQFPRTLL